MGREVSKIGLLSLSLLVPPTDLFIRPASCVLALADFFPPPFTKCCATCLMGFGMLGPCDWRPPDVKWTSNENY